MPHGGYIGDDIGYLELFVQGNPAEAQKYIDNAHAVIRTAAEKGARGWVIDLRCNRGGNMWPMITAAGPLMGDGLLGKFINTDRSSTDWIYQAGKSAYQKTGMTSPTIMQSAINPVDSFDPQSTPVSILTSEFTASAGEMTVISFRGRDNTCAFGEKTSGETTGVAIHELEDGALLGIAESIAADRLGKEYFNALEPDVFVPINWFHYGTSDDPVLIKANLWVQERLRTIK